MRKNEDLKIEPLTLSLSKGRTRLFLVILFLCSFAPMLHAEDYGRPEQPGFFLNLGGVGGVEFKQLKKIGGGLATQVGYHFSRQLSVLVETDLYYTKKTAVHYFFIPVIATAQYAFYQGAFAYAGAGYQFLRTSSGRQFGVNITGASYYHGWTAEGGAGYEVPLSEGITMTPQLGFQFQRVSGTSLLTPNLRLLFGYHF